MTRAQKILSFDDIVAADDSASSTLDIPEWGGAIRLQSFSKATELTMRAEAKDASGNIDSDRLEMLMLVHGVAEPELTAEAIPHLRLKSAAVIDRILAEIVRLNRLGPDAVPAAVNTFPAATGEGAAS